MDVLIGLYRFVAFLVRAVFWLLGGVFKFAFHHNGGSRRDAVHGSARWATRWEQFKSGALTGEGLVLGKGAFGRLIRFTRDGLVMVFANTGTGKGLGVVVPTLLTYKGSMVVTDPKGENHAITARRREQFGKVRVLNPLDLGNSDSFNPMDIIRRGTAMEVDDATGLAALMVRPDAREAHWDDKAASTLKCLILHTLTEPAETRTLAHVRTLSVGSVDAFMETVTEIAERSPSAAARDSAQAIRTSAFKPDGSFSDEFTSILSNVQKATEPWSATTTSGLLAASSSFQLTDLIDEVTTLYICVPEEFLEQYGRWMRVMVGCVLHTLTRAKRRAPKRKVLLLLDEVRVLGRLDLLEKQAGLLRAYCTPVLIWQNLPQVLATYGDGADAFMATATCRVFFGVEDNITAHYVATMIGNTTTLSTSTGVSQSSEAFLQHNRQQGQAESGYWLRDPAEIQRMPVTRAIIKVRGIPYPVLAKRIDYRKVLRWRRLWDRWRRDDEPEIPASPPPVSPGYDREEPTPPPVMPASEPRPSAAFR